jgi:FkbM family methyltransferase
VLDSIGDLGGTVRGVVHVGANTGQEAEHYARSGVTTAIYIEPIEEVFAKLRQRLAPLGPHHIALQALCAEEDGRVVDFHIASNQGASSSMLEFGWCREEYPELDWMGHLRLTTQRLDTVLDDLPQSTAATVDLLVIDTQGTELRVLEGAPRLLKRVAWIYTEVNEGGLYKGDCSFEDVYAYLTARGFRLKGLKFNRHRWGDALFARAT